MYFIPTNEVAVSRLSLPSYPPPHHTHTHTHTHTHKTAATCLSAGRALRFSFPVAGGASQEPPVRQHRICAPCMIPRPRAAFWVPSPVTGDARSRNNRGPKRVLGVEVIVCCVCVCVCVVYKNRVVVVCVVVYVCVCVCVGVVLFVWHCVQYGM